MQHFDLAVIGSGSGNSLIDERFADLKIALIERDPVFGGTCLNRGCIPTKMFVLPADFARGVEHARRLGVDLAFNGADWPAIRNRIFGRIDPISRGGLSWRVQSDNVTVFQEEASFVDPHTLQVGEGRITADRIVIATGSRPRLLDVAGSEEMAAFLHTSDDIMRMDELPERLVIVGGGYIAAEFAHIFSALGSEVTLINRSEVLLRYQDREVANRFQEILGRTVKVRLNQKLSAFEPGPAGDVQVVTADRNGVEYVYFADAVLQAVGRVRNSDVLNLAAAGVEVKEDGQVRVDGTQRTTVPHIYAMGDVSSDYLLKHVANAELRTVQHNLLYPDDLRETDHRYVPAAVFSDPQLACVGATEEQLRDWGVEYVSATQDYGDVAYGWAMEDRDHFVKLLADPHTRHLLGAHVIGPQASTLIQPLIQAMSFGLTADQMARGQYWIHPALPEVVENALLQLFPS
ncbi:MAG: mycothione reductase [Tessaracoccus sp.]